MGGAVSDSSKATNLIRGIIYQNHNQTIVIFGEQHDYALDKQMNKIIDEKNTNNYKNYLDFSSGFDADFLIEGVKEGLCECRKLANKYLFKSENVHLPIIEEFRKNMFTDNIYHGIINVMLETHLNFIERKMDEKEYTLYEIDKKIALEKFKNLSYLYFNQFHYIITPCEKEADIYMGQMKNALYNWVVINNQSQKISSNTTVHEEILSFIDSRITARETFKNLKNKHTSFDQMYIDKSYVKHINILFEKIKGYEYLFRKYGVVNADIKVIRDLIYLLSKKMLVITVQLNAFLLDISIIDKIEKKQNNKIIMVGESHLRSIEVWLKANNFELKYECDRSEKTQTTNVDEFLNQIKHFMIKKQDIILPTRFQNKYNLRSGHRQSIHRILSIYERIPTKNGMRGFIRYPQRLLNYRTNPPRYKCYDIETYIIQNIRNISTIEKLYLTYGFKKLNELAYHNKRIVWYNGFIMMVSS